MNIGFNASEDGILSINSGEVFYWNPCSGDDIISDVFIDYFDQLDDSVYTGTIYLSILEEESAIVYVAYPVGDFLMTQDDNCAVLQLHF